MRRGAPHTRAALAVTLLAATLSTGPRDARAQSEAPPQKPFAVQVQGEVYIASVWLGRIFTPALREKLGSGLTTTILVRARILDLDTGAVKALNVSEYSVLYRVWEEDFIVRHWSALGERNFKLRRYEDVHRRIARQRGLPLATRADLPAGGRYQAVIEVEIDPVSQELLQKVREYLANPGGHRDEGSARGLFGNLARIFFDPRMASSGSALELRSQPFAALPPLPDKP